MTTHVFIVDNNTFPIHLRYLFAGTGAKDKDVDFNSSSTSGLYPNNKHAAENSLVAMMADCCRIRENDLIIFYLQASNGKEGRFFGVFQVVGEAFLDRNDGHQYLVNDLGKSLTFRIRIRPYQVYEQGVTEWQALDEIREISSPCKMLWSLIYRKLKGNRGNTMVTIYESERLIDLIRRKNEYRALPVMASYNYSDGKISASTVPYPYTGRMVPFDILPRLVAKYNSGHQYEAHLQMYITQMIGREKSLDRALGVIDGDQIEWIGNEVSCGVGMQRIDVMLSVNLDGAQRIVMPVELKSVTAQVDNVRQISRYIDWIEQYYVPNRVSIIQPVLICKGGGLNPGIRDCFHRFNDASAERCLPLKYIEYEIDGGVMAFNDTQY